MSTSWYPMRERTEDSSLMIDMVIRNLLEIQKGVESHPTNRTYIEANLRRWDDEFLQLYKYDSEMLLMVYGAWRRNYQIPNGAT